MSDLERLAMQLHEERYKSFTPRREKAIHGERCYACGRPFLGGPGERCSSCLAGSTGKRVAQHRRRP